MAPWCTLLLHYCTFVLLDLISLPYPPLSTIVNCVAVAGSTGRSGCYVVKELLLRNVCILAMVRNVNKADNVLDHHMQGQPRL
jgi:hypothetical protein